MGIGDSISKAAENAVEDLGGTSEPADDGHAPDPDALDEDIKVHSSISEGSNALDAADVNPSGSGQHRGPGTEETGEDGASDNFIPRDGGIGRSSSGHAAAFESGDDDDRGNPRRDVPGPAGLPGPDPDDLRADPSEADSDPSKGLGRG